MHSDAILSSPAALLAEAELHSRLGHYDEALDILEHVEYGNGSYSAHSTGMVCAAMARNKLHAQDDQGALQFLSLISNELRAANPKIDAECHTVMGILHRRQAYKLWKKQQKDAALLKVDHAIAAFEMAYQSAQMALEDRLLHNAVLNRLYVTGLKFAILDKPQAHYRPLVIDAVVAESASRESTPLSLKDDLSGLTILVDLACGGGLHLNDLKDLSEDAAFHAALRKIVPSDTHTWAQLMMHYVREAAAIKPEVEARALLLGCKMLRIESALEEQDLHMEYATRLRLCALELARSSLNVGLQGKIADAFASFPQEISRRATHPKYLR